MRPEEGDAARLWHMLQAARAVRGMLAGMDKDAYVRSRSTQMAVERGLEIIGEAARVVSDPFRDEHPEIPWRQITGQRNIIAHGYYAVSQDDVWDSATIGVPELIAILEPLVPPVPPDPEPGG